MLSKCDMFVMKKIMNKQAVRRFRMEAIIILFIFVVAKPQAGVF